MHKLFCSPVLLERMAKAIRNGDKLKHERVPRLLLVQMPELALPCISKCEHRLCDGSWFRLWHTPYSSCVYCHNRVQFLDDRRTWPEQWIPWSYTACDRCCSTQTLCLACCLPSAECPVAVRVYLLLYHIWPFDLPNEILFIIRRHVILLNTWLILEYQFLVRTIVVQSFQRLEKLSLQRFWCVCAYRLTHDHIDDA